MKQLKIVFLSIILCVVLSGCTSSNKSESYSSQEAKKRGDIVYSGEVYNVERFDRFTDNVKNKKADQIRVTGYTDEGDPIFKDLVFDGEVIHYTYDTSHDKFGGSGTGKYSDVCTQIKNENGLYSLSNCSKNSEQMNYFLIEKKQTTN
jgi:spore coat polysaccharide biosynthesis protein SpsF (cytidylyltransferase family)